MALYPLAEWRLIEDEFHDGAWNMAVDEAILRSIAGGDSPATLRLYGWRPACVSLGRGQPADVVDWQACEADGVACVRRATGGRAILHRNDVTYSICLPLNDPRARGDVTESYRRLSEGLAEGVSLLGVSVERASAGENGTEPSAACFDASAGYEIVCRGRKLLGSAQLRSHGALLQHGSLLLYGDVGAVVDFLALSGEERGALRARLRQAALTLEEAAGRRFSFREVADALQRGIGRALNVHLERGRLEVTERRMAAELAETKYAKIAWARRHQPAASHMLPM